MISELRRPRRPEAGLATYVCHDLNPTADEATFLFDADLAPSVKKNLVLLNNVEKNLESKEPSDLEAYFVYSKTSKNPNIPTRAGYYVGYLVAQQLRQKLSLEELAHLDGKSLLAHIHEALQSLTSDAANSQAKSA